GFVRGSLGVERPAFRVPRGAGSSATQVEFTAIVNRLGQLQLMARHTLVVHGCLLAPGAEFRYAFGDGPPHLARAGEVVRRRGVVVLTRGGGCDHVIEVL